MTTAGERLIKSARQALAHARGEDIGSVVHEPAIVPDDVDIKAIRKNLPCRKTASPRSSDLPPIPFEIGNRVPENRPSKPAPF